MKKIIPYEKLGKKAKKDLNRSKRGSWGSISCVTRVADTGKHYKRSEEKRKAAMLSEHGGDFMFIRLPRPS